MADISLTQVGVVIIVTAIALLYQLELDYDPLIVQRSAVVARNTDDVFKYLKEVVDYPKWTGFVHHVEPLDNSAFGIGKSYHVHLRVPTGLNRYHTLVRTYTPNSELAFDLDMDLLQPIVVIEVTEGAKPGLSKVSLSIYSQRRSYLFRSTILPVARFVITGHLQGALFHMKLLMQQ
ncbi:uncharacterized protein LOC119731547 [Patiria miniata]|uniref:Uncharacterized protein n=1 Tax=Patiria miniata TaxID=46514 RepID=A0A914A9X7_PATMI|nr:uncharacterized protein LOC119731547 [Patiria miniata]XP_038060652.1 uncharacterized protein LOC119731547 [Patiria miniata]